MLSPDVWGGSNETGYMIMGSEEGLVNAGCPCPGTINIGEFPAFWWLSGCNDFRIVL
jgi:hypothetical protein